MTECSHLTNSCVDLPPTSDENDEENVLQERRVVFSSEVDVTKHHVVHPPSVSEPFESFDVHNTNNNEEDEKEDNDNVGGSDNDDDDDDDDDGDDVETSNPLQEAEDFFKNYTSNEDDDEKELSPEDKKYKTEFLGFIRFLLKMLEEEKDNTQN